MDLQENATKNISIPFIGAAVASLAATNPGLLIAWMGISSTYLFLKEMDPRADDFMKKVHKHMGGITEEIVKSTEFQQSLLVTFDALIRTRNEEKRSVIKNVYLTGYISSKNKQEFELERLYQTTLNLSTKAINYLSFLVKEILPSDYADSIIFPAEQKVSDQLISYFNQLIVSDHVTIWIKAKSEKIRTYINENLSLPEDDINEEYINVSMSELAEFETFHEVSAELVSAGIFYLFYKKPNTPITPFLKIKAVENLTNKNGEIGYSYTKYGIRFMNYLIKNE